MFAACAGLAYYLGTALRLEVRWAKHHSNRTGAVGRAHTPSRVPQWRGTTERGSTLPLLTSDGVSPRQAYLGGFLPLPVVLAGARWDTRTAAKTLVVTALLLTILAGAHRALSYVLLHGGTGLALAALWRAQVRVLAATVQRCKVANRDVRVGHGATENGP
jgi:hypothetical protein